MAANAPSSRPDNFFGPFVAPATAESHLVAGTSPGLRALSPWTDSGTTLESSLSRRDPHLPFKLDIDPAYHRHCVCCCDLRLANQTCNLRNQRWPGNCCISPCQAECFAESGKRSKPSPEPYRLGLLLCITVLCDPVHPQCYASSRPRSFNHRLLRPNASNSRSGSATAKR